VELAADDRGILDGHLRAVAMTCEISTPALGITACGSHDPATGGHAATSPARGATAATTAAAQAPPTSPRLWVVAPVGMRGPPPNPTICVSITASKTRPNHVRSSTSLMGAVDRHG
jgi:hypothetical protein